MAAITSQIIESAAQYPTGLEHPITTAVSLAAAAGVTAVGMLRYQTVQEAHAVQFSNPLLQEATDGRVQRQAKRDRMVPLAAELFGAGLLAAQFFGHPTYETTEANTRANVVVLEDASTSMVRTQDVGTPGLSRFVAVNQALRTADYEGRLGVVQAAANTTTLFNLTTDWRSHSGELTTQAVNSNGGNLVDGLSTASQLLPQVGKSHEGTIVVISDGTVDSSSQKLADKAKELKSEGIAVKVVVPGTATGTYTLKDSKIPVAAGANAARFDGFGPANVVETKTAQELTTTIHELVHDAGTSHKKHNWYVPLGLGVLIGGYGFIKDKLQRVNRVM